MKQKTWQVNKNNIPAAAYSNTAVVLRTPEVITKYRYRAP